MIINKECCLLGTLSRMTSHTFQHHVNIKVNEHFCEDQAAVGWRKLQTGFMPLLKTTLFIVKKKCIKQVNDISSEWYIKML